jgi:UDP-N-acetylglucosamine 2-epimerase (non-hydrolysing)
MRGRPAEFAARICVTAQHRGLLDQVLDVFGVTPDIDLDLMTPGQTLFQSTSRILAALEAVVARERADMVLVQGDTTTTFAGALAAFYSHTPVGHVEAGLRTADLRRPFPEEMNRVLTTRLAAMHFAPTRWAAGNLRHEGVAESSIAVTGNTSVDAVLHIARGIESGLVAAPDWPWLDVSRKLILVTAHRRESFGAGMLRLCDALERLAERNDVQIAYPVHPNPNVQEPVRNRLGGHPNVRLLEPLSYVGFIDLMRRAHLLLTDSGGVQEEAPSLGKPVLVLRDTTERPEAVEAGTAILVGTDPELIEKEATLLLDDEALYRSRAVIHNPFGDGCSAARISNLILSFQVK